MSAQDEKERSRSIFNIPPYRPGGLQGSTHGDYDGPARRDLRRHPWNLTGRDGPMSTNTSAAVQLFMREGVPPERVVGKKLPPPPIYTEARENGLYIQRNVSVRLRDGIRIFVDIYRPDGIAGEPDLQREIRKWTWRSAAPSSSETAAARHFARW